MRRIAAWVCVALLLGCGHDRPPAEYQPAGADCVPLAGDWLIDDADLRWLGLDPTLLSASEFPLLSIERDANGHGSVVLRRRRADILAEAGRLRSRDADVYRAWRLALLRLPPDPELASLVWQERAPRVEHRVPLYLSDCSDGWWRGGAAVAVVAPAGHADPALSAFVSLGLRQDGALLIEHHVRREHAADGVFFGQPLRYYRYAYSTWHRIQPLPASRRAELLAPIGAADLPPVAPRSERQALALGRERGWSSFVAWLRDFAPTSVNISRVRQVPAAFVPQGLAPHQIRAEVVYDWPAGTADPVQPLLERDSQVSDIQSAAAPQSDAGRQSRHAEFTLSVRPIRW
jgi:hypothetical protein